MKNETLDNLLAYKNKQIENLVEENEQLKLEHKQLLDALIESEKRFELFLSRLQTEGCTENEYVKHLQNINLIEQITKKKWSEINE